MISAYQSVYLNRFGNRFGNRGLAGVWTTRYLVEGWEDWEDSRTHIRMCTQTYRIYERVYVCVCVCVQKGHHQE